MAKNNRKNALGRQIRKGLRRAQQRREAVVTAFAAKVSEARELDLDPTSDEEAIFRIDYQVTEDPVEDRLMESVPANDREAYENAFNLIREQPRRAIAPLKRLAEMYPQVPTFANNLLAAYSATKSHGELSGLIVASYERNPEYLFAKVNYANHLISVGRTDEVAEVLGPKLKLTALYPDRSLFHFTEHVAYIATVGRYFAANGRFTMALRCWEIISEHDHDHPVVGLLERDLRRNPMSLALEVIGQLDEDELLEDDESSPDEHEQEHRV